MGKIKNKLYDTLVHKNGRVWYEYERYVREHMEEHKLHPFRHYRILLKLNWFYRVKKGNTPYLYWDTPLDPIKGDISDERTDNSLYTNNNKIRKKNRPYCGVESRIGSYSCPSDLVNRLMKYDIISFDMFDTLIFRPFSSPKDVFFLVGEKLNILDFINIRQQAEQNLRDRRITSNLKKDVNIYEIYREINHMIGLEIEEGINTEFSIEYEICYANPYMKYVFDCLQSLGKEIYILSDMYWGKDYLKKILEKCGFNSNYNLYVSCEYEGSKKGKEIYSIFKELPNKKIIHVGDNKVSDYKNAIEKGLDAYLYQNTNKIGNKYRAEDMSNLVGGAYRGIINNYLHNSYKRYDAYFEYGFIYGGLFCLGYCNYIHKYCKTKNIKKIFFVARDGYILKQVYDLMFEDETDYIFWSRILGLKVCANRYKNEFLKEYVYRWIQENKKITFKELFANMDLEFLLDNFIDSASLDKEEYLTQKNIQTCIDFIDFNWDKIMHTYKKTMYATQKYLKEMIDGSENICIVDVGWRGQGALEIKDLVENIFSMNCHVYGLLAASAPTRTNVGQLTSGTLSAYMFSPMVNLDCFNSHSKKSINNIFMELFVGAKHPSLKNITLDEDGDYQFVFDHSEVANYQMIEGVQTGILAFVNEYLSHFKNMKFMYDISGHDAYMPIKHIFSDYNYIKKYFGKYSFQDIVGGTNSVTCTIKDIAKKHGI